MPYAAKTKTPASKSRQEILRALERFGVRNRATTAITGVDPITEQRREVWRLTFQYDGREVRFDIDGIEGGAQAVRQRYRALLLSIKAQLVAVDSGFMLSEHAFLLNTIIPVMVDGMVESRPALEVVGPMLREAIATGAPFPPLLSAPALPYIPPTTETSP